MTNEEQKLRGFATKQFPLSKELKKEVLYNLIQQAKQDECLSDLTALISEGYIERTKYNELLQQRDELREALAEQKRLYFSLFDEETSCMYCEAKIRRGSAIILCKECVENTEI